MRAASQPASPLGALALSAALLAAACSSTRVNEPTPSPIASVTVTASATPESLTAPSLRGYHSMVEAGDLGTLMFGGYFAPGPPGCCSEDAAWAYSTAGGWVDLGLTPDELPDQAYDLDEAVYDTGSRKAVIYNSVTGFFTYNPDTNEVQATPSEGPLGLFAARMAYDAESDRIVLFGFTGEFGRKVETWTYDVDTDTWTRMDPEVSPPGRTWHGMAYDARADLIVLFGGFNVHDEYLGDTWTYDLDTWTEVQTKADPGPRAYFDMAYVPTIGRTILFGGTTGPWSLEEPHGDTWAFDAKRGRWTELSPDEAPSPRGWHSMAYDATGEVIVLFGGGPSRDEYTAETWVFDPRANTWSLEG